MAKTLFIPGFLDKGEFYGRENSVEIWDKNTALEIGEGADLVIAHSAGALLVLRDFEKIKNAKIVLVNPLLEKSGLIQRWLIFLLLGGARISKQRAKFVFNNFFEAHWRLFRLLRTDIAGALKKIPRENIILVRSADDKYMYQAKTAKKFKEYAGASYEIEGLGHNWSKRLGKEVDKIIASENAGPKQ